MSVSYKRLIDMIEDNDLSLTFVGEMSGVSPDTLTRIRQDKYVSLSSLEQLAKHMSKIVGKKLQLSDLCELKY